MKLALTIITLSSLILSIEAFEAKLGRVDFRELLKQLYEPCGSWVDSPTPWTDDGVQSIVNEQLAKLENGERKATFEFLGKRYLDCTIVKHTDDTYTFWGDDNVYNENDSEAMQKIVDKFCPSAMCSSCILEHLCIPCLTDQLELVAVALEEMEGAAQAEGDSRKRPYEGTREPESDDGKTPKRRRSSGDAQSRKILSRSPRRILKTRNLTKAISDTSKTPIQELHHGYSKVASARLIRKRGLQSALEPSPGSALPPQNAERQAILDTINRSVQKALIAAKADYPIPHLPANFIPPPMLDDASLHSRSDPMFCRVSSGYRELLAQQKIMDARVRKAEIEEATRRQNERAEELEAERIRIREREHPKEIDRDGSGHIANTANVTPQVIRLNTPAHPHVKPEVTIQIRNPNTPMGLAALKRKE